MTAARPSGHSAVMAQRQPTEQGDREFFPTPPWAARAGGELIKRLDPAARSCWEPACGEGHMLLGLRDYFAQVSGSDIEARGAGAVFDFLTPVPPGVVPSWDWVVTNPPFSLARDFVRLGLQRARRGVAIMARLGFLEPCEERAQRHELLFGANPVTVVAPFAERVPMLKGRWDPNGSTATAYAWFVWLKGHPPGPRLEPIPPGTRKRLSRASDLVAYGLEDGE